MKSLTSISLFLFFLPIMLSAQTLQQKTEALALSEGVSCGRFAFQAISANTGEVLVSYNADKKMIPASNMKLLTTYAAIDILGPDHVFETHVGYSGSITEGVLEGDLVIQGGGDPSFGSSYFTAHHGSPERILQDVVSALKDLGVSVIKGKIRVDNSYYAGPDIPAGYAWDDVGNYYAAGAHALSYRDNLYKAYLMSAPEVGGRVEVYETVPKMNFTIESEAKGAAIRSDMAYFYPKLSAEGVVIHGEIPKNKNEFKVKGAIPDPGALFSQELNAHLNKVGIWVEGAEGFFKADGETAVLGFYYVESPILLELVKHTNMTSSNLFAEHLLRQIGKARANEGSYERGVEEVEKWLSEKGISPAGLHMKDGSGLSRANTVTVKMMTQVMKKLREEDYYRTHDGGEGFMYGLPVAGLSGSMKKIGKGTAIQGKMRAKTGYIGGVRAYTGAVVNAKKEVIVFSIMANDHDLSASSMRGKLNELLVELGR